MVDQKFTVVIKKAHDYRIYPGDDFYGAPTPDGERIFMNVCVDHIAIPNYVQHPVSEEGRVDTMTIEDQATVGNVERELLCGISIGFAQAKRLRDWLIHNIELIERNRG